MSLPRLSKMNMAEPPIGGLDRQITIQQRTATNTDGQLSGPWTDFVTLWARIEQLSGKEVVNNVQYSAEVTTRFVTTDFPGIEARMRIKYVDAAGATHYSDILFPNRIQERGFFLELLAQEINIAT
jgi:SPP1 family predicted phage head-tail adaptor